MIFNTIEQKHRAIKMENNVHIVIVIPYTSQTMSLCFHSQGMNHVSVIRILNQTVNASR